MSKTCVKIVGGRYRGLMGYLHAEAPSESVRMVVVQIPSHPVKGRRLYRVRAENVEAVDG